MLGCSHRFTRTTHYDINIIYVCKSENMQSAVCDESCVWSLKYIVLLQLKLVTWHVDKLDVLLKAVA